MLGLGASSLISSVGSVRPNPRILQLKNPCRASWQSEVPILVELTNPSQLRPKKTPLIFLHGMEYSEPEEVIRDLIVPFERQVRLFEKPGLQNYEVYFLSWDSAIFGSGRRICTNRVFRGLGFIGTIFRLLEKRAYSTVDYFKPYIEKLLTHDCVQKPFVVSHSLGALIWAELIQRLKKKELISSDNGFWLNLQPAIAHDSFRQEFSLVPTAYQEGRTQVWFSKLDIILSSAYLLSKRRIAMGQIGSTQVSIAKNVTRWVREAHGAFEISAKVGGFFPRVGPLLKHEINHNFGLM